MFHIPKRYIGFAFSLTLLLIGCSPAGPLRIASYPSTPVPRSVQPIGAGGTPGGYFIDLTLLVPDVDRAAREAATLARSYSGYSDQHICPPWSGERSICIRLVVPAENIDYLRSALRALGSLVETRDGWPAYDNSCQRCRSEGVINLELRPQSWVDWRPDSQVSGWDPIRTLRSAWAVAGNIFAIVMDAVIWIVVVAGPFVLIGLGLMKLYRHFRHD